MQIDDLEETRLEMLGLMADVELGKVCREKSKLVEMGLVFLNWCVYDMEKRRSENDIEVMLMKIEYYRLKDRFAKLLLNFSLGKQ